MCFYRLKEIENDFLRLTKFVNQILFPNYMLFERTTVEMIDMSYDVISKLENYDKPSAMFSCNNSVLIDRKYRMFQKTIIKGVLDIY